MSQALSLSDARKLAISVLERAGTAPDNAQATAAALVLAEADGLPSHGLQRLPAYADQVLSGKVNGIARPQVTTPKPSTVRVDAGTGFAFPAIEAGLAAGLSAARENGVAAVGIHNSHHFGVAGHPVEKLAEEGMVGLAFTNSPAAMAPWGGNRPIYGTNPIAFAWPRKGQPPLVIDLSLSKVARGKIMVAAKKGEPIPEGWALDKGGNPTTDPKAALDGAMLAMGDAKGAALALMVEMLAASLTGANHGFEASSFFSADGPAPAIGHLLLIIDAEPLSGGLSGERAEMLISALTDQDGTRLPGSRRLENRNRAQREGIAIPDVLLKDLQDRAA